MKAADTIRSRWRAVSDSIMRYKYALTPNAAASDTPVCGMAFLPAAARRDPKVAALLALLWQDDALPRRPERPAAALPPVALAARSLFIIGGAVSSSLQSVQRKQEAHSLKELAAFIHTHTPHRPNSDAECVAALVLGLNASLCHNLRELRQTDEIFPIQHLSDALQIIKALQLTELHETLCELLIGASLASLAETAGRVAPIETLCWRVQGLLAHFDPDRVPGLWQMLRDPQHSLEIGAIVTKMRDPAAVPYLLDLLAALPEDDKTSVVIALQNIADMRAIPCLQAIANSPNKTLAPRAAYAVAYILRHSQNDAALLLRSSNACNMEATGKTLLRPAPATSNLNNAPDELLRAAASGPHGANDTPAIVSSGHEKG